MSVIDFIAELESQSTCCNNYKKHEETLLRYSAIQPDTIRFDEYIALNPTSANKTAHFICYLADKHNVKIIGKAEPFWVGPSTIQKEMFFRGMQLKRLLKWYQHYGFIVDEQNKIIREPKNESKS